MANVLPSRLSKYLCCNDYIVVTGTYPTETNFSLQRRLEMETTQLIREPSWKEMRTQLEAEAMSKVTVKEHLNKLFSISQELSGKTGISVDKIAVFLLRLFVQEPVTSTFLKLLMKHVFGTTPSALVLHRIYKIVNDIAVALPSYTLEFIGDNYKKIRFTQELFGRNIKFMPLNRSKNKLPDVSHLKDVLLIENQTVEKQFIEDEVIVKNENQTHESKQQKFADYKHSVRSVHWRHFDNADYEEMKFHTNTKVAEGLDIASVKDLNETMQYAFGLQNLHDIESVVFEPLLNSKENVLLSLPLGFDKTNIILMAVLSLTNIQSNCLKTHNLKVLHFVASKIAAEQVTVKLNKRLRTFGIVVRSCTDPSHFSTLNMENVHILVTTLNVWNASVDRIVKDQILKSCQLLAIDELGWLQEDHGPALETLVTRVMRQAQNGIRVRIVGFITSLLTSDCAPTFFDVAEFLQVDASNALVVSQFCSIVVPNVSLIRVKTEEVGQYQKILDEICCSTIDSAICNNQKVVVFINSEAEVVLTAQAIEHATYKGQLSLPKIIKYKLCKFFDEEIMKTHRNLVLKGYLFVHSGMTDSARNFVIKIFKRGLAKLIVTTSDFAWMLKSQADTVVIKETEIYSEEPGTLVDVGISTLIDMLAVATYTTQGDTTVYPGNVIINTSFTRFEQYVKLLKNEAFLESQLVQCLPDCLNSEISSGALSCIKDCEKWFKYTYFYHRVRSRAVDFNLGSNIDDEVNVIMSEALEVLHKAGMIRYLGSGNFTPTDLSYIACTYAISYASWEFIEKYARSILSLSNTIEIMAQTAAFSHIQIKASDIEELIALGHVVDAIIPPDKENANSWKITVLLQAHFLGSQIKNPGLQHDQNFIVKKMARLARAMFEVYLCKKNASMANRCLELINKIENEKICDKASFELSKLQLAAYALPLSRNVFQINIHIVPTFSWKEEVCTGTSMQFWLWIEDSKNNFICNHIFFRLNRKIVETKTQVEFTLPVTTVAPVSYHLKVCVVNEKQMESVQSCDVKFGRIDLPTGYLSVTGFLDLKPLPVCALQNKILEEVYSFHHFSPVITQTFHSLYHKTCNVLLSTPSSQQRITAAEISIFSALCNRPGSKVVYITPFKTEVRERAFNWQCKFKELGWEVQAFVGNTNEDKEAFLRADIIVATTYHWEVTSRTQEIRKSIAASKVSLVLLNELQVMDTAMEIIVSRLTASEVCSNVRIIGLSHTNVAYAKDIGHFLGIPAESAESMYNFGCLSNNSANTSATRVHVVGFVQKHYDTRMLVMTHAVWNAIQQHLQPKQSVTVLVPTQNQVLLTAQELLEKVISSDNSKLLLQCPTNDALSNLYAFEDVTVEIMIDYGIGILHSGMSKDDCEVVLNLYSVKTIRVLVMSMDMVSNVRTKSHLVIVKGTEYYSVTVEDYVDIPVPEVVHNIYSCSSCWKKAIIFTQDSRKTLYHAYFQGALLVESQLLAILPEYLNNEIVARTVESETSAVNLLAHTYLGHRLASNPAYYLSPINKQENEARLSTLVEKSLCSLKAAGCVTLRDSGRVQSTVLGSLCSLYNLSHNTVKHLSTNLNPNMTQEEMVLVVCKCQEFKFLHLRVDDEHVRMLEKHSRWTVDHALFIPLVLKVFLLLQAHFSKLRNQLITVVACALDIKEILDAACRIVQAVVVICSDRGWLKSALQAQLLLQMIAVGSWGDGYEPFFTLPHVTPKNVKFLICRGNRTIKCLQELRDFYSRYSAFPVDLEDHFQPYEISEIDQALKNLPTVNVQICLYGSVKLWILKELNRPINKKSHMLLSPRKEYTLSVELREIVETEKSQSNGSWTLIFGIRKSQQLLAMRRVRAGASTVLLTFMTCGTPGEVCYTLYLMSDNHIGLDQQFDIYLNIAKV